MDNSIGPIPLILRYAKDAKEKCRFLMTYDEAAARHTARLHFQQGVYVGVGSSRKEARQEAARLALSNLTVPETLREKRHPQKRLDDIPNEGQTLKCKALRQKRVSSLNRKAHEKGLKKKDNPTNFLTKSRSGERFGVGFTQKEAKDTLRDQLKPETEDGGGIYYEIFTPSASTKDESRIQDIISEIEKMVLDGSLAIESSKSR